MKFTLKSRPPYRNFCGRSHFWKLTCNADAQSCPHMSPTLRGIAGMRGESPDDANVQLTRMGLDLFSPLFLTRFRGEAAQTGRDTAHATKEGPAGVLVQYVGVFQGAQRKQTCPDSARGRKLVRNAG